MSGTLIATAGPFMGVRNIRGSPYIDSSKFLYSAKNMYFRDVKNLSSAVARPGFSLGTSFIAVSVHGQGTHPHVDPATGTTYRFFAASGKLYRSDSSFTNFTDVSPAGITIDSGATTRVSMISVGASMVVTDGVNRPWIAANFGATPITGTYIDIDGAGGSWSTWGKPTVYQDSVMFITATVPGGSAVQARVGFVWCEPNQPAVGYTQTGYANFWNMIETGSDPLYALLGTNNGLFVWRASAITVATGTPSINFSSTATRDARGDALGTISPWAVAIFGNNIFFPDTFGRPWMMPLDGEPQPIWKQMDLATQNSAGLQSTISYLTVGAIAPQLNLYVVALYPSPSATDSPRSASVFDGNTGDYAGEWVLPSSSGSWTVVDIQLNVNGSRRLCVISGGSAYILDALEETIWHDDGGTISLECITRDMGYSANRNLQPDTADLIVGSPEAMSLVAVQTVYETQQTSNVSPRIPVTQDGQYLATVGLDGTVTRYAQFTVRGPTSPTEQWGLQRIDVYGATCAVGIDDK